jgi:hypothetical protein
VLKVRLRGSNRYTEGERKAVAGNDGCGSGFLLGGEAVSFRSRPIHGWS